MGRGEDPAETDLLRTLGRQAGQALERARLHEETARQADRAGFLLEAARMLAEAADVAETVDRLAELAVRGGWPTSAPSTSSPSRG